MDELDKRSFEISRAGNAILSHDFTRRRIFGGETYYKKTELPIQKSDDEEVHVAHDIFEIMRLGSLALAARALVRRDRATGEGLSSTMRHCIMYLGDNSGCRGLESLRFRLVCSARVFWKTSHVRGPSCLSL